MWSEWWDVDQGIRGSVVQYDMTSHATQQRLQSDEKMRR